MSTFLDQHLYRSWRVAGRRIVSSGNCLHHQRAGGVFLCLESLETREQTEVTLRNHVLQRMRPLHYGCNPRSS